MLCNDDAAHKQRVQDLVAKEHLKHVVVGTAIPGGPPRYRVAKEADVTVVVYADHRVVAANFPLKTSELDARNVMAISAALRRVLPER